jgi:hypothetical protein
MNEETEIGKLCSQNPEFMLFTLSFTSLAMRNITLKDSSFKNQAVKMIDKAIENTMSDTIYRFYFYPNQNPFETEIDSNASVLYLGHLNLMLGTFRMFSKSSKYNILHDKISKNLYNRYKKTPFMCLTSYPQMIWIADNTVALASLKLHSKITGSPYQSICQTWVDYAKINFIDRKTGLLYSTLDHKTGKTLEEPRGSMLGWSILFIAEFDIDFAREMYHNYKEKMSDNFIFFRLFKEKFNHTESNHGDIDSGPIIYGYSIPANAFAFAGAVLMNDLQTANQIHRIIRIGRKYEEDELMIKFRTRFIEEQFSPMGEALFLYFETLHVNFR